jgi:DNA polymerase-1
MGNGVEILGEKEICEKWQIRNVSELIDILGLMGDKVDNIPGIPGVGEKTAIQLIKDFGSIENLLTNTDKLKGKLKEKVELNKELALLSKKLATIITDCPIEFDEKALLLEEPDKEKTLELFRELEFRRLAETLFGESIKTEETPVVNTKGKKTSSQNSLDLFSSLDNSTQEEIVTIEDKSFTTLSETIHHYKIADQKEKIQDLILALESVNEFSFDTETTSLDTSEAELVGLSFSIKAHEGWYVPIPEERSGALEILNLLIPVFHNEKKILIGQNIKYDMLVLSNYGITIKNILFDTMVAHFLISPEMRHNMNLLSETYLNYSPISIETLIGKKGSGQLNMRDVPLDKISEYAVEDSDVTLQLKHHFKPELQKTSTEKLFEEVEMPLIAVLAAMEKEGVKIDVEILKSTSGQLEKEIQKVEKEIQEAAVPLSMFLLPNR